MADAESGFLLIATKTQIPIAAKRDKCVCCGGGAVERGQRRRGGDMKVVCFSHIYTIVLDKNHVPQA